MNIEETTLTPTERQSYPVSDHVLPMTSSLVEDGGLGAVPEPVQTILDDFEKRRFFSEEHKRRLSEAQKRNWQRPEYRAEHSGENHPSKRPEVRAKLSELMNRHEIKAKFSGENNPMKRSEIKAKISGQNNPMKRPEVRVKFIGEKNPMKRPENRTRFSGDNNPMRRPEVRAKFSESMKRAYQRPEVMANHSGKNNAAWKGGISFLPYCPKFNEYRKEETRNEYERACVSCGKTELLEGRCLAIHHVDGDKMQGCKGKPWSLVPLCKSCHSKLHRASEQNSIKLEFLLVMKAEEYRRAGG